MLHVRCTGTVRKLPIACCCLSFYDAMRLLYSSYDRYGFIFTIITHSAVVGGVVVVVVVVVVAGADLEEDFAKSS
jgi:hypothetical protein